MTEIIRATTAEHFAQFEELVDELKSWDSFMTAQMGLDFDLMVDFLYKQPSDVSDKPAYAEVFLATHEGSLAGCGALKQLSNDVAELSRLYVRPAHRGEGIGKAILEVILVKSARIRLQEGVFGDRHLHDRRPRPLSVSGLSGDRAISSGSPGSQGRRGVHGVEARVGNLTGRSRSIPLDRQF